MAYIWPQHSRAEVDSAGRRLIHLLPDTFTLKHVELEKLPGVVQSLNVINNWRASHRYPLFLAHKTLQNRVVKIDPNAFTADRIKRLRSVADKLRSQPTMRLSRVNDIGGCRAVLTSADQAQSLVRLYLENTSPHWELARPPWDYIEKPKESGYRSVHLAYKYRCESGKYEQFDGHRIEIQIRSKLQHSWATTVEVAETFTNLPLKSFVESGGHGLPQFSEWKRFFAIASGIIAYLEGKPAVPDTPGSITGLRQELQALDRELNLSFKLRSWVRHISIDLPEVVDSGNTKLFLIQAREAGQLVSVRIRAFKESEAQEALDAYFEGSNLIDAVLVTVESIDSLRRAYPNYYADTTVFLDTIRPYLLTAI